MKVNLRVVRYVLVILVIIVSSFTVKVVVNNFIGMEDKINELKEKQKQLKIQTHGIKNYYTPFLKTEYAKVIFAHRNGIVLQDEVLVKIVNETNEINKEKKEKKNPTYNSKYMGYKCLDFFKFLYEKYLK